MKLKQMQKKWKYNDSVLFTGRTIDNTKIPRDEEGNEIPWEPFKNDDLPLDKFLASKYNKHKHMKKDTPYTEFDGID